MRDPIWPLAVKATAAWVVIVALLLSAAAVIGLGVGRAQAACRSIDPTWWAPSGTVGCSVYGEGIASWYHGDGVARNDCEWPWTTCAPIRITSLDTGREVVVTPTMFCGCYTGTPDERLVDLDPPTLAALGLDPARGLYPVRVEPVDGGHGSPPATLPDTAMR